MKKLGLGLLVFAFVLTFGKTSLAEEEETVELGEVVVTATRIEEPIEETGSSVTVITAEEIKEKGLTTVKEVLKQTIGLDTSSNAPFGGPTSLFIRGANSGHTLIMIDGVKVYDPISTNASFDFANLTTDNIERIEIIRGPQSSLYGSDAIGGVINIITKKGEGKPRFNISFEGGSHRIFRESLSSFGSIGKFDYSFTASRLDSDGISKAHKRDGNPEKDKYENSCFFGKFDYHPSDDITLGFLSRYNRAKFDLDDWDFIVGKSVDDSNHRGMEEQVLLSTYFDQKIYDWWKQNLKLSWMRNSRQDNDDNDPIYTADYLRSWYKGQNRAVDWQHNFSPADWDTIITGFQYNKEEGKSLYSDAWGETIFPEKTASNKGYYLENKLGLLNDHFFNTLSVRTDDHSKFGDHTTYKTTLAYLFDNGTKVRSSYGTGFKAPSLYQLYAPPSWGYPVGNENLKPEESKGWDVGVEQSFLEDKVSGSVTYFKNDFKNLIDWDGALGYINIGRACTRGIETELKFKPIENLNTKLAYTYLNAKDKTSGDPLVRRAKNKYNLNTNYSFLKNGNLNLNIARFTGRHDVVWPNIVSIKDYTKVDLAVSYDINKYLQVFTRIENLFDQFYEEAKGYGTLGRSFYAGLKGTF